MWRTAIGLEQGVSQTIMREHRRALNEMSPQCPVNLHTLHFRGHSAGSTCTTISTVSRKFENMCLNVVGYTYTYFYIYGVQCTCTCITRYVYYSVSKNTQEPFPYMATLTTQLHRQSVGAVATFLGFLSIERFPKPDSLSHH